MTVNCSHDFQHHEACILSTGKAAKVVHNVNNMNRLSSSFILKASAFFHDKLGFDVRPQGKQPTFGEISLYKS